MGLSSKEVSSAGIGSDRFLTGPSSSMKKQSSSASASASALPSSTSSQQQKQQQSEPLMCPRCDSTNTKFCYYNNYNKSQPRHFCKTCKRHWTKGGTLRNVPVGGGRKNKRKMSNTAIKATSKTTTITAATAALINGISNTTMTTIQPQQPRLNLPLGTPGGVDEKNLSEAFYQTLGRHPPCSMPESSIGFSNKSVNEGNNGIFLGSTLSLPPPNEQDLNFPFLNLGGNFESNRCSISSIQSSNLYNYTGDQANSSLEETIMNGLNTNLSSSPMSMGDHHHQQSWSMATNTSSMMGMTSNWGWDDIDKFVSVDESELTMPLPWDDADIKP